jgi:hypothetical protein
LLCIAGFAEQTYIQFQRSHKLLYSYVSHAQTHQAYPKGMPIEGIAAANAIDGVTVYHAGTKLDSGVVKVSD